MGGEEEFDLYVFHDVDLLPSEAAAPWYCGRVDGNSSSGDDAASAGGAASGDVPAAIETLLDRPTSVAGPIHLAAHWPRYSGLESYFGGVRRTHYGLFF